MAVANIQDHFTFKSKPPVRVTVEELLKKPGEGEQTTFGMVIKARTRDLGGDFSVMEGVMQPQELIAPHLHRFEDQLLYVISGELEFELGGQEGLRFTAPAGSYVRKPRGILHAYWNATNEPCRYIELSGRSGFESFVDAVQENPLASLLKAKADWGIVFAINEISRLMKTYPVTRLAMLNTPDLSRVPDLTAALVSRLKTFKRNS
ncbi:MAG: cupin domain-containing protein [Cyanobacteria bacterium P01_G01_bin.54]